MRSMLSSMSARHAAGSWLEGTAPISLDIGPQTRLLDRLGEQIDIAAEDLCQTPFQANQAEQPDACVRVEFRHEVDIAVCRGLTARERTEQAKMTDAGALQFGCVRAQCRDDSVRSKRVENGHEVQSNTNRSNV
jgi:hypothetical protein